MTFRAAGRTVAGVIKVADVPMLQLILRRDEDAVVLISHVEKSESFVVKRSDCLLVVLQHEEKDEEEEVEGEEG